MLKVYTKICLSFTMAFLLLTIPPVPSGHAEDHPTPWKVGLAAERITPEEPLWMIGYATRARFRPSNGVLNDLYAKALAIESDDGQRAVLIAVDLCVFREPLAKAVTERICERTKLTPDQVLVSLSHTHSGPLLGYNYVDERFPMSEEEKQQTIAYTRALVGKLADLAAAALDDMHPARLSYAVGEIGFVTNRRRLNANGDYLGMGPNPDGDVDRTVPVLRVDSPGGEELRAVVFGCACHNVTLGPSNLKISGDFSGFAAEAVERAFPGVQAMFITGCAADANPYPRSTADQEQVVRRQGEQLAAEVVRVVQAPQQLIRGSLEVARKDVALPLMPVPGADRLEQMAKGRVWHSYNARRMLHALENNETLPSTYSAPMAVWRFGDDLTLIALSGEVVVDYVRLLREHLSAKRLWIAAYCNEVFGYLPSARILAEGGYETRGLAGDAIGFFSPEAERLVVEHIKQLAEPEDCDDGNVP
jgi:hypothetical protein